MYFEIISIQINMTHIQSFKYFLIYEMSLLNGYPLNCSKLTSNIFEIDQCNDLDLAISSILSILVGLGRKNGSVVILFLYELYIQSSGL